MQRIEFEKLSFKNFRCHSEGELTFPNNELVAITGRNGRGKSSYFMAFQVALYGKTAEGIELSELVNKRSGKDLEVYLKFNVIEPDGTKAEYQINRYYQHKKYGSKLLLMKDGVDISGKTSTDTYKTIESILIPRSVFLNTVYFSQQVKDFFTALTDAKQKEIFESILQLEEWAEYYKRSSAQVKQKEVDIANIQNEYNKLTARIPDKELELERLKFEIKLKLDKIAQDRQYNEDKIKQLNSELEVLLATEHDVAKLTNQFNSCNENLAGFVAEMKNLQTKKDELKNNLDADKTHEDGVADTECTAKLQTMKLNITNMANSLKETYASKTGMLNNKLNDLKVEQTRLNGESESELSSITTKYDTRQIILEKNSTIDKKNSEISGIDKQLVHLKNTHTSLTSDKNQLTAEIQSMTGDKVMCPTCNQEVVDKEHVEHLEKIKANKQNQLAEKEKSISEIIDKFNSLKEQKQTLLDEIKSATVTFDDKLKSMETEKSVKLQEHSTKYKDKQLSVRSEIEKLTAEITSINDELEVELQKYRDEFTKQKEALLSERNDKLARIATVYKDKFDTQSKLIKDQISSTFASIQSLTKQKDDLTKSILTARETERSINEKNILKSEANKRLDELNVLVIDESDVEIKQLELNTLKESADTHKANLAVENEELEILKFWKTGFSDKGIPSMLIDENIPFMNATIKRELEKIAPGKFIVSFDTISATKGGDLREKFSVNILNVESGADSHKLLSGGEKRQIDVCCMRVLRLLSEKLYQKSINVTFLDEVLDSLDSDNASIFCQHLKALSTGQNITIITHSMLQDAECDKVLSL